MKNHKIATICGFLGSEFELDFGSIDSSLGIRVLILDFKIRVWDLGFGRRCGARLTARELDLSRCLGGCDSAYLRDMVALFSIIQD